MALGVAAIALACCHRAPPQPPPSEAHYTIGAPYQIGGVWRYPRADFSYDETGVATVAPARHPTLTADGEAYDATAMAAAHRTLQLPAIARLTNLDTGLSALVRLNDRGPAAASRLVEVTPRVAQLLQIQDGSRVRLQVMEGPSRQLAASTSGGAETLLVTTAPAVAVSAEQLPPPPGVTAERTRNVAAMPTARAGAAAAVAPPPPRLPETVTREPVQGGDLYVDLGAFSRAEYARLMASRLAALGAAVTTDYDAPRDRAFIVRSGPYTTVATADAALDRALRAGVTDANIVVGP